MKVDPTNTINRVLSIRKVLTKHSTNGKLVSFIGDSAFLLFDTREDAISFVRQSTKELPEKINFGIACGEIYNINNDYFGYSINLASKYGEDIAKGGQVLTDLGDITEEIYEETK
jgi:class 3 adenylate cyclase